MLSCPCISHQADMNQFTVFLIRNEKKIHKNHELFKEALIKTAKYAFASLTHLLSSECSSSPPRLTGSIHFMFSITWKFGSWRLEWTAFSLSFGVLRSDESFVPWYCNQILFHLSIWPKIRYNESMGICCLGEKWVILKYRMFYFLSK